MVRTTLDAPPAGPATQAVVRAGEASCRPWPTRPLAHGLAPAGAVVEALVCQPKPYRAAGHSRRRGADAALGGERLAADRAFVDALPAEERGPVQLPAWCAGHDPRTGQGARLGRQPRLGAGLDHIPRPPPAGLRLSPSCVAAFAKGVGPTRRPVDAGGGGIRCPTAKCCAPSDGGPSGKPVSLRDGRPPQPHRRPADGRRPARVARLARAMGVLVALRTQLT